jgi:leucyl aminopeptidase
MGATGKADEVVKLPGSHVRLLVFTGLGKSSTYPHEVLRRAAGSAARSLAGNSAATFSLPAPSLREVSAIAEGAALGAYAFTEFRGSTKAEFKSPLKTITVHSKHASTSEAKATVKRAEIIAKYTFLVRDLINTPPSHLTPDSFTKKLSAAVKTAGGANLV